MRLTKSLIDRMKGIYRVADWTVTAKKLRGSGKELGQTLYISEHKKAAIIIHPEAIQKEKRTFHEESQDTVLHHEFAEVVMANYETGLPKSISEHPKFVEYKDMLAEHWSRVVMELLK